MKKLKLTLILAATFLLMQPALLAQNHLQFSTVARQAGTAFFSLNSDNGQVYYMLDYGPNAGTWKAFGKTIENTAQLYAFAVTNRGEGTAFFAQNKNTGQIYYMLDYGDNAGNWTIYGNTVPAKANATLTFAAHDRIDGTAFFSQDRSTGQVYFMLDYGNTPGVWKAFGNTIEK